MILFEKVFRTYNNHKLIGIESYWYLSKGWKPFINGENPGLTIEQHLELAHQNGCSHVDLILEHKTTGNAVFADFAMKELMQPDTQP